MIIYLLRHTKPEVPENTFYGHTDLDIYQKEFEEKAEILKQKIPLKEIDKIISSPLKRCYKLAKELGEKEKLQTDNRIKELNFGDWEMQNWNSIDEKTLKDWYNNFNIKPAPNGESHMDMFKRVKEFWNELLNQSYSKVCVVTHAGVINSLLALVLEMPLKKSFSIQLRYNELIRIKHNEDHHYSLEFLIC